MEACSRTGSILRDSAFCPGSLRSAADMYVRKVGRPRLEWVSEVHKLALKMAGTHANLERNLASYSNWQSVVHSYCSQNVIN